MPTSNSLHPPTRHTHLLVVLALVHCLVCLIICAHVHAHQVLQLEPGPLLVLQAQPQHTSEGGIGCRCTLLHTLLLLDNSMAAAPQRKRQLLSSIDFSLPRYQFWVMFSVLTTKASELGRVLHKQQVRHRQWQQTHKQHCRT